MELWMATEGFHKDAELRKHDDGTYTLSVCTDQTNWIKLDRKALKDLFNAIGNELNAF